MLRRLGLALIVWLGLGAAVWAETRVALILAAQDYQLIRPLTNPANDARAMEDLLKSLDFKVFVETDRDLRRMRRALEDFQADAAGADVALLFFAGHGVALDGVNYLLPTDTDGTTADKLVATALPLSEAQAALQAVAPVAIVLLDACRDDPFAGGGLEGRGAAALDGAAAPPPPGVPVAGLGRIGRADGVLFAFAAAPNETASDGDGENSPFTEALVRHFGTAGVELKTALTLVQQDVYDRSRGKQLPYVESGLPELVFITGEGVLPERDQLLIAMADLTPDLRAEVEALAADRNMPLAPLYAALLSADLANQAPEERTRLLLEAATSYETFQSELSGLKSEDPRVADLRTQAQESFALGAFDTGRALLDEAADIDAASRANFRDGFIQRTISEAATRMLSASAARAELRYDLAIEDLNKAAGLFAEIANEDIDRQTRFDYIQALVSLGDLQLVAGNTRAALDAFSLRAAYAQAQVEADPTDVDWVRELIWSLTSVGNVLESQGYMQEAETAFASALEFSEWQAGQMPDDVDLMRDRMLALNDLGESRYAQNELPGALDAHERALELVEALLATDPQNYDYLRNTAFTRERVGDVLFAMGNKAAARAAYQASIAITEGLAADYPGDEGIRHDLSVAYERIGDVLVADLEYEAALELFSKSLVIREELAAIDPDNTLRRRDLSVAFERIGGTNALLGDIDSALLAHQAVVSIREALAALDPTNMVWQRDLSVGLELLGNTLLALGDLDEALAAHERCRALREMIVSLDPQNLPRQRDLGVSIANVGVLKAALGDSDGAFVAHQEALDLRRAMVAADPSVLQYQRDTTYSLALVADTYALAGNYEAAEPLIAEAALLKSSIAGATPDDLLLLTELSNVQNRHVDILLGLGRAAEALSVAEQSLQTADRLLQLAPDVPSHTQSRLVSFNRIGDAQVALGDNQAAVQSFQEMSRLGSQLLEIDPFSQPWASDLAIALERLGNAQAATGDFAGALKSHQDCLALRDWLVQQDSANEIWYGNLSISYERVSAMLVEAGDMQGALDHQEMSVTILRDLVAAFPDIVGYRIDLVRGLDLKATLLLDPTPANQEALAILEDMYAQGTLPAEYVEWIPAFRKVLGLPTDL